MDGVSQTIQINDNVTNISDAITAVTSGATPALSGASAANDGSGKLKITSATTGTSSTVAITTTGSGANALALFGTSPFTTTIGNGDANIIANGFLSVLPGGTGNQNIKIHSSTATTGDFMNSSGKTMKIDGNASNISNNGADIGSVNIVGGGKALISIEPKKIGFANADGSSGDTSLSVGQYVERAANLQFRDGTDSAFSPLKSSLSGNTIITAANMGVATIGAATAYGDLGTNSGATTDLINGRLAVRVASIANTEPVKGRN